MKFIVQLKMNYDVEEKFVEISVLLAEAASARVKHFT
jgi:hypothetical protein